MSETELAVWLEQWDNGWSESTEEGRAKSDEAIPAI